MSGDDRMFRAGWPGGKTGCRDSGRHYDDAFDISGLAMAAMQRACGTDVLTSVSSAAIRPTEPSARGEIAHAICVFTEGAAH